MTTFNAGAIEAKLALGRSAWNVALRKLRKEIADLEKKSITISVDLFTDNAYVAMDNLEMMLDHLDRQTYEPNVELNTAHARTLIRELNLSLTHLDARTATVSVDADIGDAVRGIAEVEALAHHVNHERANITINADADIGAAEVKLGALDGEISLISGRDINISVDMDMGVAEAQLALLDAEISALDHRDINVKVDTDKSAWDRLVGNGGSGSSGGSMGLLKMLIVTILALLPIFVVAVDSAAAAIIGFAAAIVGAIGPAAILAAGIYALYKQFKKVKPEDRTPAMWEFAHALEAIKDVYHQVLKAIGDKGFQLMATGLNLAGELLPYLVPLFNIFATAIENVLTKLDAWIKLNPDFEQMLSFFGGFGIKMLLDFIKIGGNLLTFFGNLFAAMVPFTSKMIKGLVDITGKWAAWAETLNSNPAFQDFLKTANKYGPMVLDMLGSLWFALLNIAKAVAPFAGPMLVGLTAFFDFIANMDTSQLSILLQLFTATFLAVKFGIPVVTTLIDILPLLGDAIMFMLGPVGLIILALAGLAAVVYYLWTTNKDFRDGIIKTWTEIQTALSPIIKDIWDKLQTYWGPIKSWAMDIWTSIQDIVTNAMVVIEQIVHFALIFIQNAWALFGGNLFTIIEGVAQIIGGAISGMFQVIDGIFMVFAGLLTGDWDKMWEGIKKIGEGFWTYITAVFEGGKKILGALWDVLVTALKSKWDDLFGPDGSIRLAWTMFRSWIDNKVGEFKIAISAIWEKIKTDLSGAWGDIFGGDGLLRTMWNNFTTWLDGKISDLGNTISGIKSKVAGWAVGIWDGIQESFRSMINTIIGWWNNLSFHLDIPNAIPGLPNSIDISTPNLPYLAKGGVFDDPTLAIVGDTPNEPEIVSPVSKMREVVFDVLARTSGLGNIDYNRLADAIASRMLPNLNVDLHSDETAPGRMAEEILFWLRQMGYGGKYANAS